ARIMKALSDARINIRMIDQGSSEINIIICVDEEDYENAIRSIYNEIEFTL
ncbi:MAG: ACT domain-containing protein, partial [Lachnospiraceae bacterium]|nr:ACT domain-containing protein [Lachnospiraceae bacterium]